MSLVQIQQLKKTYNTGKECVPALDGVSVEIAQGEFVAVMGPSGSGKSTLLSILGGLNHPSEGSVIVDGIDVYSLSDERRADFRREYLGFVFQSFQLLPYLTILENVMIPLVITGRNNDEQEIMAKAILENVGLGSKAFRLPDELSGGEQQRVAIARGLVNQPPIVLADEPTGELDSTNGKKILDILTWINREYGKTIVVVTHDDSVAIRANRIIKLQDGRMVSDVR